MQPHPVLSNESRIRLTAFFVLVLTLVYLFTGKDWVSIFLLLDFTLRAFGFSVYSPLSWLSGQLVRLLHLQVKPVYMPPKRFAARIGFVFFVAIVLLQSIGISTLIPAGVIVLFAALESLANFCAGCYVYNVYARLRSR